MLSTVFNTIMFLKSDQGNVLSAYFVCTRIFQSYISFVARLDEENTESGRRKALLKFTIFGAGEPLAEDIVR